MNKPHLLIIGSGGYLTLASLSWRKAVQDQHWDNQTTGYRVDWLNLALFILEHDRIKAMRDARCHRSLGQRDRRSWVRPNVLFNTVDPRPGLQNKGDE